MNLILIRGLPGSGKSTLAQRIVGEGYWFEADHYFMNDGVYVFDRTQLLAAHKWCQSKTDEHLGAGYTVVVSNTFTTKKELVPYFDIAKKHGVTPTVILCQNEWGSVHDVHEETMLAMLARFEFNIQDLFKKYVP